MHDVAEFAGGNVETSHITGDKMQILPLRKMRGFGGKSFGIPRQNGCRHAKAQLVVDVGKGLQQPHAEKARSARDKKRSAFRFVPKLPRVREDMIEILDRERFDSRHVSGCERCSKPCGHPAEDSRRAIRETARSHGRR